MNSDLIQVPVCDEKYTFEIATTPEFVFRCRRYGEPWIDNFIGIQGSKAVYALVGELSDARARIAELESQISQSAARDSIVDDSELPGMWERADFEGGAPIEVRGPDWRPAATPADSGQMIAEPGAYIVYHAAFEDSPEVVALLNVSAPSLVARLEEAYRNTQNMESPWIQGDTVAALAQGVADAGRCRSTSVGDVIQTESGLHQVRPVGFEKIRSLEAAMDWLTEYRGPDRKTQIQPTVFETAAKEARNMTIDAIIARHARHPTHIGIIKPALERANIGSNPATVNQAAESAAILIEDHPLYFDGQGGHAIGDRRQMVADHLRGDRSIRGKLAEMEASIQSEASPGMS